jgi:hypothetical protein
MQAMFAAREAVLDDGLSRLTRTQALAYLRKAKDDFLRHVTLFRLGGDEVLFGADDVLQDPAYKEGMYKVSTGASGRFA